jgi:hypothetical protein
MPILLGHPASGSGRTPEVIDKFGLGFLFNTKFGERLTSEGWFDIEKANKVDNRVLRLIEAGHKVELSTGLGVKPDKTPGVNNGKEYHWVAREQKPDHLAVLIDAVGACSIGDGCGINNEVNKEELELVFNAYMVASGLLEDANTTNTENDMKLSDADRKGIIDNLIANCSCTYKEGDREALGKLDDGVLSSLGKMAANLATANTKATDAEKKAVDAEAVLNTAREGVQVGDKQVKFTADGKWEQTPVEPVKNESKQDPPAPQPITIKDLPQEVQNKLARLDKIELEQKRACVGKLIANLKDDATKEAQAKRLMERSIEDLEADVALLPTANVQQTEQTRTSYLGQFIPATQVSNQPKAPEPLGLPQWDFSAAN